MPKKKSGKRGKRPAAKKQKEEKKPEVKDVKEDKKPEDTEKEVEVEDIVDTKKPVRNDIKAAVLLTLQAVESKEHGLFTRIVRLLNSIRKKQTVGILASTIDKFHPELKGYVAQYADKIAAEHEEDIKLAAALEEQVKRKAEEAARKAAVKVETEEEKKKKEKEEKKKKKEEEEKTEEQIKAEAEKAKKEKEKKAADKAKKEKEDARKELEATKLLEVKALVHYLTCCFVIDNGTKEEAAECAKALLGFIQPLNKRSMDHLSAKAYYCYCLTQERLGQLGEIRTRLLEYHRTAVLQHNEPGQAMLIVCILRAYLAFKLYTQADNFRLKTTLPESRPNDVYSRYLYYIAQINAVQLQYSDAFQHLTQAIRKAPQHTALGFRQTTTKLLVIVQLLMGEIPERSVFTATGMKQSLAPYLQLTQAVRVGDLAAFETAAEIHKEVWQKDGLSSLIARLRNNVIKTGLRKINLSYSRISLEDIKDKLNLGSADDAEFIVSKCIHDGVIDAVLDRKQRFMFSKDPGQRYASYDPQAVFHKRVLYCMDIHNGAVKALRFPANAQKTPSDDTMKNDAEVELEMDSMDDD